MNRLNTGIKVKLNDGIEVSIVIEHYTAIYPYEHKVTKIWGEPTKKGMNTKQYQALKAELNDYWVTDLTNTWHDAKSYENYAKGIDIGYDIGKILLSKQW